MGLTYPRGKLCQPKLEFSRNVKDIAPNTLVNGARARSFSGDSARCRRQSRATVNASHRLNGFPGA